MNSWYTDLSIPRMGVDGVVIKSRPSKFGVVCYFDVIFPFINTNKNNNYSQEKVLYDLML